MAADSAGMAVQPGRFHIRFWGTRGTCPSPGASTVRYGGNTSCVEVRSDAGDLIVLDAGTGARALGAELQREYLRAGMSGTSAAQESVVHVLLSHRHGDHVLGLPHFTPLLSRTHTVCMLCGNSDAAGLRPFIQALLSPPMFPLLDGVTRHLDLCDWSAGGDLAIGAQTRVHRLPANHPGEAAVLRIDHDGRPVVAYAPDNELAYASDDAAITSWRDGLAASLRGVPVLVHDATYTEREIARHAGWGHSSAEEATRFAIECGAERLVLFHHHPDRTDDAVDAMLAECTALAAGRVHVSAAREGDMMEVTAASTHETLDAGR